MKLRVTEETAAGVVDMQNCFADAEKGTLVVTGTEEEIKLHGDVKTVTKNIKEFIDKFFATRFYFTTEDKHPKGHREFDIFPEHAVEDTEDAAFVPMLDDIYKKANSNIIKGDDIALLSYSVGTSSQFGNHINSFIGRNIDTILLMGLAYNFCVGESAIDYARQGFNVYIVRDLTLSVAGVGSEIMDHKLSLYGVNIIMSKDIYQ